MLRRLDLRGPLGDLAVVLPRPSTADDGPLDAVRAIVADVRDRGDMALRELTARYDGVDLESVVVDPADIASAPDRIDPVVLVALEVAAAAIRRHHEGQRRAEQRSDEDGLCVRSISRPVRRAGCYAPGGRAAYPSTVLMTAVPARVAGVEEVILCVPPGPDGRVADVTLAAAAVAGVDAVYAVGGAQAVAAMAYGTASIPAVDVIAGPGNVYVALAKREVAGHVGVPSAFAGPSEVVVVADSTVPPEFAAIDVVVQAEHGPGGLAWLITWDEAVSEAIEAEVDRIVATAPRRDEITATLDDAGWSVLVDGPDEALAVADAIAPEHLQLMVADAGGLSERVRNAGAVFCGPWSPASLGDYVAGPSHTLPTGGAGASFAGLTVDQFQRRTSVVKYSKPALAKSIETIRTFAEMEGLDAHGRSAEIRLED